MVCLGNEQRSFCHFWDCTQVLHFGLFCWPWWLLHVFWGAPARSSGDNSQLQNKQTSKILSLRRKPECQGYRKTCKRKIDYNVRSTSSHHQRGFMARRTKQFGVFSPVALGVGWVPLDRCQLLCNFQPCCPRHSLTYLRAGPQTPKYSLVVALRLSKQNSRWGRWQGSQGHVSILPHSSANLDLDIQKLPLHWGGPSSQL